VEGGGDRVEMQKERQSKEKREKEREGRKEPEK
jgi:hypothetical protein